MSANVFFTKESYPPGSVIIPRAFQIRIEDVGGLRVVSTTPPLTWSQAHQEIRHFQAGNPFSVWWVEPDPDGWGKESSP
jgi:hypothetical protein